MTAATGLKTVFLGSPPFATEVFQRLCQTRHKPVLLVTPPDRKRGRGRKVERSPLVELAIAHGVDVLQPRTVKDDAVVAQLADLEPDLFVVVSYGELLREPFLELPKHGSVNVHPSLLPRWRGATPIPAALLAGDELTGTTIQRMVLALDAGDVIEQREHAVRPDDTTGSLMARLAVLSAEALEAACDGIADGTASFTPQDPQGVTLCKKLKKADGELDFTLEAAALERRVRAMHPWPGAFTTLPGGDVLRVWKARVVDGDPMQPAGSVLEAKERLVVQAGIGALELLEVQAPGKRAMDAASLLRGRSLEVGSEMGATEDEAEAR